MTDTMIEKYGLGKNGHSHFSPSSSAGWLACPGYVLANALHGDTAGVDAAYGTVAHSVAQEWNESGRRPVERIGEKVRIDAGGNPYDIEITSEMLDYVEQYVDWCAEIEGDVFVEQRVDLSPWLPIPGQGGTADHFVCAPDLLTITDLKMGTGVHVKVERNPQAMLYALGAFEEWDWIYGFKRIVIRICQPRLGYFGVWECSRDDLLAFGEEVRARAALAWQENPPRVPSEKACRFCAARRDCPALSMHLDALVDDAFDAEDTTYSVAEMRGHEATVMVEGPLLPGDPLALSTAFLAYRLRYRKMYEGWFNSIYDELLTRAEKGETIPGWKLAKGRRSYKWRDADDAAYTLIEAGLGDDDIYHTEITSVAKARKLLRAHGMKAAEVDIDR
ncbi:MAG TPA: DUF2800 domain-containing protein, partial [Tepidisphaeraceae bacterium]|nr:DUF2800 domain-containing protein [Tepidisphaeraceae bacterium]